MPFGLNRENILKNDKFFITEGHIDALSIKEVLPKANVIAVPGVHNVKEEWLCLFRDKTIYIAFDNDEAGKKAAEELKETLAKYNSISIKILNWDYDCKDMNELLKCGKIIDVIE